MAIPLSSTEILGSRLLREIAAEEGSLEDVCVLLPIPSSRNFKRYFLSIKKSLANPFVLLKLLKDLRTAHSSQPSRTGIPELDDLWKQHGGKLAITGRGYPLLCRLVDHMVTDLNGTVALVDVDGRFSPSHLTCELQHVHVWRPTKSNFSVTLESVEGYMLWGDHASKGREWVGTIVNGGVGDDIMVDWRGWLRVEKEETGLFGLGFSVEEAIGNKERRQEVVDKGGWKAVSEIGAFNWK